MLKISTLLMVNCFGTFLETSTCPSAQFRALSPEDEDGTVHVNGTLLEVPKTAMNTKLQLCISFESSTSSDQIVVLAHHTDVPTKLSAYSSHGNQCFKAPTAHAGNYSFAVFVRKSDSTLEAPATAAKIWLSAVSTSGSSITPTTTTADSLTPLYILLVIVGAIVVFSVTILIACIGVVNMKKKWKKSGTAL